MTSTTKSMLVACGLLLTACSPQSQEKEAAAAPSDASSSEQIRDALAQKLMLDIRHFCTDGTKGNACRTPTTSIPDELKPIITQDKIGGIILFAENLQSTEQIIALNHQIQNLAAEAGIPPLLISVDQEGGRVVRIPPDFASAFAGNMAIGATYTNFDTKFASTSGFAIGQDLQVLGFNVNLAPTVDVNVNPENPVINVRSYSENPEWVGKLGLAQMEAMQQAGVAIAIKHFPGHGDTTVDSHVGLPLVSHDRDTIERVDLAPFRYTVSNGDVDMIMTAHIQFPNLDNTTFVTKDGTDSIVPATMSSKILRDLLRDDMGYKGVVITDALDMHGIAHFFEQTQAVIETFKAGSDIALMPLYIRSPEDVSLVSNLLDALVAAVESGELDRDDVLASAKRITDLKDKYKVQEWAKAPLETLVKNAAEYQESRVHRAAEQELADASIVMVKNNDIFPITKEDANVLMYMPDDMRCKAMESAFAKYKPSVNVTCEHLASVDDTFTPSDSAVDLVILGDISPQQSPAEVANDASAVQIRSTPEQVMAAQQKIAEYYHDNNTPLAFVTLRTPYIHEKFEDVSDAQMAAFSYNISIDAETDIVSGPIFNALVKVMVGDIEAKGSLPVSISKKAH
ncbi:glycoside hydrolase family 3 protein [Alteromonas sediminis]|nr:glycoside hydrolase family 3 protein [Alteromonas sediminis]